MSSLYEAFHIEYKPEYDVFAFEDIIHLKCGGGEAFPSLSLKKKKKREIF